jgi:predicted permease
MPETSDENKEEVKFNKDNSGDDDKNYWWIIVTVFVVCCVVIALIFIVYRVWMKRDLEQNMKSQINTAVS